VLDRMRSVLSPPPPSGPRTAGVATGVYGFVLLLGLLPLPIRGSPAICRGTVGRGNGFVPVSAGAGGVRAALTIAASAASVGGMDRAGAVGAVGGSSRAAAGGGGSLMIVTVAGMMRSGTGVFAGTSKPSK
jgi:hypothetical protein